MIREEETRRRYCGKENECGERERKEREKEWEREWGKKVGARSRKRMTDTYEKKKKEKLLDCRSHITRSWMYLP